MAARSAREALWGAAAYGVELRRRLAAPEIADGRGGGDGRRAEPMRDVRGRRGRPGYSEIVIESPTESVRARLVRLAVQTAVAGLALAGFELGARTAGCLDPTERPDPYLGFAGTSPLFRLETDANGLEVFRTSPNKGEHPPPESGMPPGSYRTESFLARKPERAIRIFCLGGSSVRSDAYDRRGTFPAMLEAGLAAIAGPDVRVEVLNVGGGGTGSYQYREVAREVRHYGADLLVVYAEAGERKYIPPMPEGLLAAGDARAPARPVARRLLAPLRGYVALRETLAWLRNPPYPALASSKAPPSAFATAAIHAAMAPFSETTFTRILEFKRDRVPVVMEPAVSPAAIATAHEGFVSNLLALVEDARAAGVPVLFVDTVRSLKADFYLRSFVEKDDFLPDPQTFRNWRAHYELGLAMKKEARYPRAVTELEAARRSYRRDKDELLALYLGQCHEAMGDFESARREYERFFLQRPLRTRLQEVVRRSGAAYVDPFPALAEASPNGIPDETMFTDAFHPQIETNRVIAETILRAIVEKSLVPGVAAGPDRLQGATRRMAFSTVGVELNARRRIQVAVYRGAFQEAVELGKQLPLRLLFYPDLMYLGWAQTKQGDRAAARRTWEALRLQVLTEGGSSMNVPRLETDADVVREVFDGDIFSEF